MLKASDVLRGFTLVLFSSSLFAQAALPVTPDSPPSVPDSSRPQPPFRDLKKLTTLKMVRPTYPAEALSQRLKGSVQSQVVISEAGEVEAVEPVKGVPAFYQAAIAALKQWRFTPHPIKGQPARVLTRISLDFGPPPDHAVTSASPASRRVYVPAEVSEGRLLTRIPPEYPAVAKAARIQGTVQLRAVIGRDGTMQSIEVLSGHPLLTQALMEAVWRWRYKPYAADGHPVEVETVVTSTFYLPRS